MIEQWNGYLIGYVATGSKLSPDFGLAIVGWSNRMLLLFFCVVVNLQMAGTSTTLNSIGKSDTNIGTVRRSTVLL